MPKIETFVIIDLETTGLPIQEYNRTKITEMCLLAVNRKDIEDTATGKLPTMCKLNLLLNPEKPITPEAARITGITDSKVKNCLTFKEKFTTINAFLQDLKRPVCLVAHNGNIFDYRILLAECVDANVSLPRDLLCLDSLSTFRKIVPPENSSVSFDKRTSMNSQGSISTLLSDSNDEYEWPALNATPEFFQAIDEFIFSNGLVSTLKSPQGLKTCQAKVAGRKKKLSLKLCDIYKRYFGGTDGITAHRAEDDCLMLLQCMVAAKVDFLRLSDINCKLLSDCKPLQRK